MELLKPIIVKRWISENKYITYVFDNNTGNIGNKYKPDDIVINEYIFQDNQCFLSCLNSKHLGLHFQTFLYYLLHFHD